MNRTLAAIGCVLVVCFSVGCSAGNTCGAGTALVGTACVAQDAGPEVSCGAGTVLVNGACVAVDGGPEVTCGAGTVLVNGACVAVDGGPEVTCGAGTVLTNGECLVVDAGPSATVFVNMVGPGTGTVTGPGAKCAANRTCSVAGAEGSHVTLTAVADTGYVFVGWRGGGCTGRAPCEVTLTDHTELQAGFAGATFWGGSDGFIYTTSLNGDATKELAPTPNPAERSHYSYDVSADGLTLVSSVRVSGGQELWLTDYWAGKSVLLTDTYPFGGVGYGGLSPDGAVFAYVNGVYGLSTLHTDGTQLVDWPDTSVVARDCYNAGCATSRYLTWSPDGAQVAWISTASVAADGANQAFDNVWVADVAQNTTSRLTNFNAATIASNPTMTGPSWSADGTHIAFVSSQAPGADRTGAATVGVTNVWSVDVTTKALFCVTNFSTEYQLDMATYARGGTKVIFSSLQDPTLATGAIAARNLFGISDSGTGLVALTSTTVNGAYNRGPVWGPDNTTVLFESNLDPVHPTMTSSFQSIWKVTPGSAATLVHAPTSSWDYTAVDNDD